MAYAAGSSSAHIGGALSIADILSLLFVNKMKEKSSPKDFSFIERENGMFSFLGLTKDQIVKLREDFHIYMVESSRINIAGVNVKNVDKIVSSIIEVL